jgi:UDP-N-acetylmuramate dehydrogenase
VIGQVFEIENVMNRPLDFQLYGMEILTKEPLARFTSARIGGPADYVVLVKTLEELIRAVRGAQEQGLAWRVLGGGSNILVADAGVRGVAIVNRAKEAKIDEGGKVYAESGVNLSTLARNCVNRGLGGLEWAVTVPGTVGGAVVGNAGAHGGDIAGVFESASVLEQDGTVAAWGIEQFDFSYRDSSLKRSDAPIPAVVLAAVFGLTRGDPSELASRAEQFVAQRKATQPPGASIGSMFKNPPDDHAGRLIDAAGLKGTQMGGARISSIHANFFVNTGGASAEDVKALIDLARTQVREQFGVELELEIELVGEWGVRDP